MGLLIWLPLNGNFNNQGFSDNLSFTTTGTINDVEGKIGSCKEFNSSNVIANYNFTLGKEFSFCVWAYWTAFPSTSSNDWIIDIASTSGYGSAVFGLSIYHKTLLTVAIGGAYDSTYTHGFSLNTWYHIAFTWDGTIGLLYVNGELKKTYNNLVGGTTLTSTKLSLASNVVNSTTKLKGRLNDVRIYDHCLSAKEVSEIAKALILHYKLDDGYIESTTNLITGTDCLSGTCYNGATGKYNYGANSDMYKTTGEFEGKFCTKVYMGTSGNSAYPYVYVSNAYVSDGTNSPAYKTISFDFFGTIVPGNKIIPYKLGSGSGTCTWVNETLSQSGSSTNSANISVTPGIWNHIVMTLHGTTEADAQWGYIRLGTSSHTSDTANYWLFANMQMELKDHATPYVGVGESREGNIIYDVSGYCRDAQIVLNDSSSSFSVKDVDTRYSKCTEVITSATNAKKAYIESNVFDSSIKCTNITISWWMNLISIGYQSSAILNIIPNWSSWQSYAYGTCMSNDGAYRFGINDSSTVSISHYALADSTFHHYCLTYDGTSGYSLKIYRDGELIDTKEGGSEPWPLNSFKKIYLGYGGYGGNRNSSIAWSDFRIYATTLTAEQVKELYNTAGSVDNTGNLFTYKFEEK